MSHTTDVDDHFRQSLARLNLPKPRSSHITTLLAWACLALPGHALAAETGLREIMLQLDRDNRGLAAAIANEDWPQMQRTATALARHAEPPWREKLRIIGWLGPRATNFRELDQQLRASAKALAETADNYDHADSTQLFSAIQQSCNDCHNRYRQPYVEYFHARP